MSNVMQRTTTIESILRDAARSFEQVQREDGSSFYRIAEGKTQEERQLRLWLADLMQTLHDDEMPNDWRYETARDLFHMLLEYSECEPDPWEADHFRDVVHLVADNLTDHSTSALFQWLAAYPSRSEFEHEHWATSNSLIELARLRQYEAIDTMGHQIISACGELL